MKSTLKILITPIANLHEEMKGAIPLSIAIGHSNDVFVLLAKAQPSLIKCMEAVLI